MNRSYVEFPKLLGRMLQGHRAYVITSMEYLPQLEEQFFIRNPDKDELPLEPVKERLVLLWEEVGPICVSNSRLLCRYSYTAISVVSLSYLPQSEVLSDMFHWLWCTGVFDREKKSLKTTSAEARVSETSKVCTRPSST